MYWTLELASYLEDAPWPATKDELIDWKSKIDELKTRSDKIYLFFNNCHLGQAVRNAKMLMEILQIEIKKSSEYE